MRRSKELQQCSVTRNCLKESFYCKRWFLDGDHRFSLSEDSLSIASVFHSSYKSHVKAFLRILRYTWKYPWRASGAFILAVLATVLVLVLPAVAQRFVDVVIKQNRPDLIWQTAAAGLGAIALRHIFSSLRNLMNNSLELQIVHDFRVQLYDKLQRLPIKWFDKTSSGEVMSRVADDVPSMQKVVVEGIDQALTAILQFVLIVGALLYMDWKLTLITLAPLPIIGLITVLYSRKSEPWWSDSSQASSALNALLHDNLAGIRQIKAYTTEPEQLERFDEASDNVGRKSLRVLKGQAVVWPGISLLAESGIILMVAFGAKAVLAGEMTEGTLLFFLFAWGFVFEPISKINPLMQTFTRGLVSAKRVFAIVDAPDEKNLSVGLRPDTLKGEVIFEDVDFSYSEDAKAADGISLRSDPGETIALVGPTGAGKSTVLNLLTRFYEADSGSITIDGTPISELSKEWLRDQTGYVTQENFLFNTSLRDNLLLARQGATDDELWQALESANAKAFVEELPEGLDTFAGERGVRFSGGEKQRLSIARALLKNPPILLLDEATSALDNTTEKLVQDALENLRADRTCFVIAHRLSTVREADRIYVLKDGTVEEQGTHEELLTQDGLYAQLAIASGKSEEGC